MTSILDYLVDQGTPEKTIILLLMLPIIAFFIAFVRQFVGIKAFGIYTPLIVTFALIEAGWKYGLAIFFAVIVSATLTRLAVRKLKLLYLPRMAIVITAVAFVILLSFLIGAWRERYGFLNVSIFPILIMITLAEKFVDTQIKLSNKEAIKLAAETVVMSILGYLIGTQADFRHFLYHHAYISLLVIPFSIFLGKWTGLRLPEYYRFRSIITKE